MGSLSEESIPTKALVVDKPGAPFVLEDVVLDGVREQELLVEIKYSGVCHTVRCILESSVPFKARERATI